MIPDLDARLQTLSDRFRELGVLLADPEIHADPGRFGALSREYAELEALHGTAEALARAREDVAEAEALRRDPDPDMRALAEQTLADGRVEVERLEAQLAELLTPRDPDDGRNVFLELRAGTGGDEAALFAGDLFRMYGRFAERRGWAVEVLSARAGEHGGFKELIARVSGREVFAALKFESGVHRVQRVPATESQGRIHTSAVTVAVLPEPETVDAVQIDPGALRIDTFRASGAGGQHVNTTDSAVRITHLPTGTVVECQDERSQHKNRARALSLLQAKLLDGARSEQAAVRAADRRSLVGSGDRSERIRTYNFPERRVTDHRIQLTLHRLEEILDGDLAPLLDPLARAERADRLAGTGPAAAAAR